MTDSEYTYQTACRLCCAMLSKWETTLVPPSICGVWSVACMKCFAALADVIAGDGRKCINNKNNNTYTQKTYNMKIPLHSHVERAQ